MLDVSTWMEQFLNVLKGTFGDRIWFVGLQGSYGRGEAVETSDIDVVVILDVLSPLDIHAYNAMLDRLSHRELVCGFLSGKDELLQWEPSDLFQFYYDTKPLYGSLDALLPLLDESAIRRAVKIGVCNIYHGCVHNMLHEKSEAVLRGLYKTASFAVQAVVFLQTGRYISSQKALLEMVSAGDRVVVDTLLQLKNGGTTDFDRMSETLFVWAKKQITEETSRERE